MSCTRCLDICYSLVSTQLADVVPDLNRWVPAWQAKEGEAEDADAPAPPPPALECVRCLASAWTHASPSTREQQAGDLATALVACLPLGAGSCQMRLGNGGGGESES